MTNSDIVEIALAQSAIDCACAPENFRRPGATLTESVPDPEARRYLELPHVCNFVTYGAGLVAAAGRDYLAPAGECLRRLAGSEPYRLFETPALHVIDDVFAPYGGATCFMAEYFLPDVTRLRPRPIPYVTRVLHPEDFRDLYIPAWSNALCEKRRELDILGVGAYHNGHLVGLAACSADCGGMWQIGIDVLPEHRRQGIARSLTAALALEILDRGKAPFYCAAWSNLASVRNALSAGFRPAWVELTVKKREFVAKMMGN